MHDQIAHKKVLMPPPSISTEALSYRERLKDFQWFEEFAMKAYEVWLQGEGHVVLEINDSETDKMGKRHRNVIISRTSTVRCREA